jgi:NTE family protein
MAINGSTLGIALSGGGFRATLFSLGSLWRLNDAGLLGKLDRVTSVSGGSILAGVLAHRWSRLQFVDGRASNFAEVIAAPLQKFCSETADIEAGLLGWITPFKSAGDYLCSHYEDALFGSTLLGDIPKAKTPGNPTFIFYATNMQTGRSFRLRQDYIADYKLGLSRTTPVKLAAAVTASSAFPPLFSPVILKTNASDWINEGDLGALAENVDALREKIILADGGIYDNMGLESLIGKVDIALVSDAGAPFAMEQKQRGDYFSQLSRVRDILIDQTRALRKRELVDDFIAKRKRGAYWGIGTKIADYNAPQTLANDTPASESLEQEPTRLASIDTTRQGELINWGYALADAALRTRAELAIAPAAGQPVPSAQLA